MATILAHGGSIRAGLTSFDDADYVTDNPHVQAGLSKDSVAWAFSIEDRQTYFHPLTWLSLMADREILGPGAAGFHAVNVGLHAVVSMLLLLVLVGTTGRLWRSLAATMLFTVHPLTVEAVAWVTERKTLLSTALGMGAVLAYVAYARSRRWAWLSVVVVLHAASLLAKPGFVVLPVLLVVLDFWPLRRVLPAADAGEPLPLRSALIEKIPLAIVSAASLVVSLASIGSANSAGAPLPALPLRFANAFAVVPRYLAAAAWPSRLSVFHPFPMDVSLASVLAGASVLVASTIFVVAFARSRPWLPAGWFWFLAALSPYLGLAQAGLWPAWADRFEYVALMGLAVAVAFEGAELARRGRVPGAVTASLVAAATIALGSATRAQVEHWHDSEALFRRAVEIEPESAVMHYNLGRELALSSRFEEALPHLELAVRLQPAYSKAQSQLGTVLIKFGYLARAEEHYREALRQEPAQVEALWNLASLLESTGRPSEALPLYERFLAADPPARFEPQRRHAEMVVRR